MMGHVGVPVLLDIARQALSKENQRQLLELLSRISSGAVANGDDGLTLFAAIHS